MGNRSEIFHLISISSQVFCLSPKDNIHILRKYGKLNANTIILLFDDKITMTVNLKKYFFSFDIFPRCVRLHL